MPQVRWARHLDHGVEDESETTIAPYLQQERRWDKMERLGKLALLSTLGFLSFSILVRLVKTFTERDASHIFLGGAAGVNVTQTFERFWDAYEAVLEPTLEDDLFGALVDFDIPIAESKELLANYNTFYTGSADILDKLLEERVQARDLIRERWAGYTAQRSATIQELARTGQLFHDHLGSRLAGYQRGDKSGEQFQSFLRRWHEAPQALDPFELRNMTSTVLRLGLQNIVGHFEDAHDKLMRPLISVHRAMDDFEFHEQNMLNLLWRRARLPPPRNRRFQEVQKRTGNLITQLKIAGDDITSRSLSYRLRTTTSFVEPVEVMLQNWGAGVWRIQAALDARGSTFRKSSGFDYTTQIRRWKDQHYRALCPPSWVPRRVACLFKASGVPGNSTQMREIVSQLGKLADGIEGHSEQPKSMWEVCCRVLFRY